MIVLALFLPPHRCSWAHEKEMFRAHSLRSLTREQSLPGDVMTFGAMVGPHSPNPPDLPDRRGVDPRPLQCVEFHRDGSSVVRASSSCFLVVLPPPSIPVPAPLPVLDTRAPGGDHPPAALPVVIRHCCSGCG